MKQKFKTGDLVAKNYSLRIVGEQYDSECLDLLGYKLATDKDIVRVLDQSLKEEILFPLIENLERKYEERQYKAYCKLINNPKYK